MNIYFVDERIYINIDVVDERIDINIDAFQNIKTVNLRTALERTFCRQSENKQ